MWAVISMMYSACTREPRMWRVHRLASKLPVPNRDGMPRILSPPRARQPSSFSLDLVGIIEGAVGQGVP